MDSVLSEDVFMEGLFSSFLEYGDIRRGIVHVAGQYHAVRIAGFYSLQGVSAAAVGFQTPFDERLELIEKFRRGGIHVIVDAGIFSEGFDCPDGEVIQLARPTLWLARYLQMTGRCLSIGSRCVVIDNVGLNHEFCLPPQDWNWSAIFQGKLTGRQIRSDATGHGSRRMVFIDDEPMECYCEELQAFWRKPCSNVKWRPLLSGRTRLQEGVFGLPGQ